MKIAVYGATGQAGTHVVAEACRRGHEVLALSRHEPDQQLPPGATWQNADIADTEGVTAVAGQVEMVVSAFGPSRVEGEDPAAYSRLLVGLVKALVETPVLVIGGAGSLLAEPGIALMDTPDFPEAFRAEALAHAEALAALRELRTDTEWTYLSPAPRIADGRRTGEYIVGDDSPVGEEISFADFAIAVVDDVEMPLHVHQRWTVASRGEQSDRLN